MSLDLDIANEIAHLKIRVAELEAAFIEAECPSLDEVFPPDYVDIPEPMEASE